ncbi:MAG: GGDEF domain-containing protein [Rubrobacter sp.]|nr:GGDEF domain-containing protein [Rubrobacter sp.]
MTSPFIRGIFISVGSFTILAIWLIHSQKLPLRIVEETLYAVPSAALVAVLVYALYLPASSIQAQSALVGVYLWLPAAYTVIFLIFEGRQAVVRAVGLYLFVFVVSLPMVLSIPGLERALATLGSTMLVQFYLSSAVFIVFLFFVARLKALLRETQMDAEEMRHLAQTDPLTGIYNRRHIEQSLEQEMERCRRYDLPLSLVIFDIDDFKALNDAFGHDAGDAVLVEMARLTGGQLRSSDYFGRWGGEEFIIVTPETSTGSAHRLADRLRTTFEEGEFGTAGNVAASFGVAVFQPGDSGTILVKRADMALYRAKTLGKNRVELDTAAT